MSLLLLILLSLFFIFVVYNLLQKPKYKLPPGPRPWPIIGNLGNVTFPTFRCFSNWSRDYGPIISVWRGPSLDILVSSAELAEQVLKENDHQLANRHRNAIVSMFTKDGLDLTWADYGPQYVKVRKVCTLELFSSKSLEALKPIREDEVTAIVESIFYDSTSPNNFGKGLLVRGYLREVTINSITRMVLGKRFGSVKKEIDEQAMEFKGIVDDMNKQSASLGLVQFIPWLKWIIWIKRKELGKHEARRDRFTRAIMAEHALSGESKTTTKPCFVEALMTQSKKYDLSDDTIIGLIWDMIIAGIDTSAILVEWAIAEVSRHPDVQLKAHQEFDMIIGSGRAMIESDLVNLPYLQCIVKETLRLHPPTPLMLPHKANADVKIGEYDIPRGSNVYVNVWAIGRDPAQWHDPLEFRPERFVVEDVDIKGHDFRLLPFGAGRRMCPGAQLGINLVSLMLGKLLHYFNWSLPEGIKPETIDMMEKPGLVAYMRTPVQAMVTPRLPKNLYKRLSMDV